MGDKGLLVPPDLLSGGWFSCFPLPRASPILSKRSEKRVTQEGLMLHPDLEERHRHSWLRHRIGSFFIGPSKILFCK